MQATMSARLNALKTAIEAAQCGFIPDRKAINAAFDTLLEVIEAQDAEILHLIGNIEEIRRAWGSANLTLTPLQAPTIAKA